MIKMILESIPYKWRKKFDKTFRFLYSFTLKDKDRIQYKRNLNALASLAQNYKGYTMRESKLPATQGV